MPIQSRSDHCSPAIQRLLARPTTAPLFRMELERLRRERPAWMAWLAARAVAAAGIRQHVRDVGLGGAHRQMKTSRGLICGPERGCWPVEKSYRYRRPHHERVPPALWLTGCRRFGDPPTRRSTLGGRVPSARCSAGTWPPTSSRSLTRSRPRPVGRSRSRREGALSTVLPARRCGRYRSAMGRSTRVRPMRRPWLPTPSPRCVGRVGSRSGLPD